jgi:hypothetical protein
MATPVLFLRLFIDAAPFPDERFTNRLRKRRFVIAHTGITSLPDFW